jgi:hypothetical protein
MMQHKILGAMVVRDDVEQSPLFVTMSGRSYMRMRP